MYYNTKKQKPDLVAFYDIRPGNGSGIVSQEKISKGRKKWRKRISGEAYDINKQTICIVSKSKNRIKGALFPEARTGHINKKRYKISPVCQSICLYVSTVFKPTDLSPDFLHFYSSCPQLAAEGKSRSKVKVSSSGYGHLPLGFLPNVPKVNCWW